MRLLQIAHVLRTVSQDVGKQRLTFGGTTRRSEARPFYGRCKIFGGCVGCEQTIGPVAALCRIFALRVDQTLQIQPAEQYLSFDAAMRCRLPQPPRTFGATGRNPNSFEIGSADPILGIDNTGLGGPSEEPKGLNASADFVQSDRATQRGGRRSEPNQTIDDTHAPDARIAKTVQPVTVRASLRGRLIPPFRAGTSAQSVSHPNVGRQLHPGNHVKSDGNTGTSCSATRSMVIKVR